MPTNSSSPIPHLVAAVLNLGYALQALTDERNSRDSDHIRQDSAEHLDEINLLADLIKKLL